MKPPPRVDVVVVNWNTGARLKHCVEMALEDEAVERLIVVDNASVDESLSLLPQSPKLLVLRNDTNDGFGKACNAGVRLGTSPHLLFLNPDAHASPGTITAASSWLADAEAEYGACGILLRDLDGQVARSCTRQPTWRHFVHHSLGLNRLAPRVFPTHFMTEWDHLDSRDVDHVIGAFYMVPRALFERLGGFDERYFLYYEDLDLSARIAAQGRRIRYLAHLEGIHEGGGSSAQVKAKRLFYSTRSKLQFSLRHFSSPAFVTVALTTTLAEPLVRVAHALFGRSPAEAKEVLAAQRMLIRWASTGAKPESEA
jgi:GT2 family glycosyltransferase